MRSLMTRVCCVVAVSACAAHEDAVGPPVALPVPAASSATTMAPPPEPAPRAPIPLLPDECREAPDDGDRCFTSSGGFRWLHPRPQGNPLRGVWVGPSGEVWAVGDHGTILRWADGRFSLVRPPLPGVGKVFARATGESLSELPGVDDAPMSLRQIVARSSDDLWINARGQGWSAGTVARSRSRTGACAASIASPSTRRAARA
jgi:hypothetical protein